MNKISTLLLVVFLFFGRNPGFSQNNRQVGWLFKSVPLSQSEAVLQITATVAPGWHLYTQFMKKGGPTPTQFSFDQNKDYVLLGITEEKGNPVTYYDDLYEMDITSFSGKLIFLQKIRLLQPSTAVKGKVSFLTCNDHVCIPGEQEFSIDVQMPGKMP